MIQLIVFIGASVSEYILGKETFNVYMVDKIFHLFGGIGDIYFFGRCFVAIYYVEK